MNIVACIKVVPDSQDIQISPDGDILLDKAAPTISEYDLNAIEAGVQAANKTAGTLRALTVGGKKIDESKLKKNVLSRGPESLTMVADDTCINMDTHQTAVSLAATLKTMGAWDLILCGEGSADMYSHQVGIQLGELLGVQTINSVQSFELADGVVRVVRSLENEEEELELPLPAVLTVTSDINNPRVPSMKDIMAAGKKPVSMLGYADLAVAMAEPGVEVLSIKAPQSMDRKRIIIEGDSEDAIADFAKKIAGELK